MFVMAHCEDAQRLPALIREAKSRVASAIRQTAYGFLSKVRKPLSSTLAHLGKTLRKCIPAGRGF
jgi:hypothetical protein